MYYKLHTVWLVLGRFCRLLVSSRLFRHADFYKNKSASDFRSGRAGNYICTCYCRTVVASQSSLFRSKSTAQTMLAIISTLCTTFFFQVFILNRSSNLYSIDLFVRRSLKVHRVNPDSQGYALGVQLSIRPYSVQHAVKSCTRFKCSVHSGPVRTCLGFRV